jgi:outer membrane receptor protein involved in Fe transport
VRSAILCGASALVLASAAHAQPVPEGSGEPAAQAADDADATLPADGAAAATGDPAGDNFELVVTGSRVVTDGSRAPTPVTVVAPETLALSTPSSIPDGLAKLPQFQANPGVQGGASPISANSGTYLNLRRFGAQRNLILLDGTRLPPTATSGAVDVNIIPQQFIKRVDIVTGGASAVYGSDAVTGVVNFILDQDFSGLKYNAQAGISDYGDARSLRFGFAAGTDLGDRAHIQLSYDFYDFNQVEIHDRPRGKDDLAVGGDGSAANPFRLLANVRAITGDDGGLVVAGPASLINTVFNQNGVASPLTKGGSTGLSGSQVGGDGGAYTGTALQPLRTNQVFAALKYDLSDTTHAYLQANYSDAASPTAIWAALLYRGAVLSGNPFIPASVQQAMTAANAPSITISRGFASHDNYPPRIANTYTQAMFVKAGLAGRLLDAVDWSANYTYSRARLRAIHENNGIALNIAASWDAVRNPANGEIVCAISLTQYASRFPNCVPFNPFGPTAPSKEAYDFITDDTKHVLTNILHDATLSMAVSPFSTWAGPVRVAVSGEYRWQSLRDVSNANPLIPMDCTGLRSNCSPTITPYVSSAVAPMYATQNVKEIAGEVLVPLLSGVTLFDSLDLSLAGRHTVYSTTGSVNTWKIGGNWSVNGDLRFRATRSQDIRAPTLYDLAGPQTVGLSGYIDLLTKTSGVTNSISGSNPDLKPEVARTTTIGAVYQPSWLPRFSLAVDYFDISMNNAITNVSGQSITTQQECLSSNGTSPFCSLYIRPISATDTSPANYPTFVKSVALNTARTWTKGVDVELGYNFDLASVDDSLPGNLAFRLIGTYQPVLKSQTVSTVPAVEQAGVAGLSKVRMNLNAVYSTDRVKFALTQTWQSRQHPSDPEVYADLRPIISPYMLTDLSFEYRLSAGNGEVRPFVTIQNLFNRKPYMLGGSPSAPGLTYPSVVGQDIIGRYFTVGIRGKI